jgi:nitrogen fixation/metabolism regulation signal transduction histidine kinase
MKIDLDKKISVYMFVIIVLVFVLLMHLLSSSMMKFTVNKILESKTKYVVEEPTKTTTTFTNKYDTPSTKSNYQY